MSHKLLIIVPAYNEEENIEKVYASIRNKVRDADILVVNDCSTDKTLEILENLGANHVNLPVNLGIGGAMQTGYIFAKLHGYDFAVQIDGDGQHDPAEVSKLIKTYHDTKANLIIGSRFLDERSFRSTYLRRVGIGIFAFVTRILIGQKISDATSGFRLVDKKVIDVYAEYYPSDYPEPEVIVLLKNRGLKVAETAVKMKEREGGKSSITALKSVYYMVKVIGSMFMQKIRG